MNLSTNICPRLSEETDFRFYLGPDPLILYFLKILVFEKTHSLFKLIFKATQWQKIPEYGIFQKALFYILASDMNLGWNAVPVAAEQYLWSGFTFSSKTWSFLGFQCIFKQVKTKREVMIITLYSAPQQAWPEKISYTFSKKFF